MFECGGGPGCVAQTTQVWRICLIYHVLILLASIFAFIFRRPVAPCYRPTTYRLALYILLSLSKRGINSTGRACASYVASQLLSKSFLPCCHTITIHLFGCLGKYMVLLLGGGATVALSGGFKLITGPR